MLRSILKTFFFNLALGLFIAISYYYFQELQKPLEVKTTHLSTGFIASYIRVTGKVVNDNKVKLAALIDGEIQDLNVDVGNHVKKNQLLVTFDSVKNTHLIQRAKAQRNLKKHSLKISQLKLKRLQSLIHSGAISREKLDDAQTTVLQKQAELNIAKENLALEQLQLKKTKLFAPYSGVITQKFIGQGQWVESGTPLLVLASDSGYEIEANIDASDLAIMKVGYQGEISADSYPNKHWQEKIKRISPAVSSGTNTSNTFPVRFTLSKKAPKLLLNQQVDIKLTVASKNNAIYLPLSALIESNNKPQVLIINNAKAKYVIVKTGIESYTHIEISDGLNPFMKKPNNKLEIILPDNKIIMEGDFVNGNNSTFQNL